MFTGLIEAIGEVAEVHPSAAGSRLRITTSLAVELTPGDSLAVNGVCLTVVTAAAGAGIEMDVSPVTARITTMGGVKPGTLLNLERSLSAGARLGGHFVQGHVDTTGVLESIEPQGESWWLTVSYPSELTRYLVKKGSVAVDGISLTVAALSDATFDVQIVPHTWTATTLRHAQPGDLVNLECDMVGKYVLRGLLLGTTRS
jgi:riboflavin synthase